MLILCFFKAQRSYYNWKPLELGAGSISQVNTRATGNNSSCWHDCCQIGFLSLHLCCCDCWYILIKHHERKAGELLLHQNTQFWQYGFPKHGAMKNSLYSSHVPSSTMRHFRPHVFILSYHNSIFFRWLVLCISLPHLSWSFEFNSNENNDKVTGNGIWEHCSRVLSWWW